jgi:hypothetical protein
MTTRWIRKSCLRFASGLEHFAENQPLTEKTMPFDPTLPANNSPVSSAELRGQFTSLQTAINDRVTAADLGTATQELAMRPLAVDALSLTVSDPPTQAEVQSIADKLNELIGALKAH